jgi:hypothetical protein
MSMVIYNTICEHCIPHYIQIYLESHRDWSISIIRPPERTSWHMYDQTPRELAEKSPSANT